jgi:hypothetical protein
VHSGKHISLITHRSFSSDASSLLVLPASTTIVMNKKRNNKIWQRDGPEGQQLKQDVSSSFHDGSLNIDNPAYMVLYQKSELYGKFKNASLQGKMLRLQLLIWLLN